MRKRESRTKKSGGRRLKLLYLKVNIVLSNDFLKTGQAEVQFLCLRISKSSRARTAAGVSLLTQS